MPSAAVIKAAWMPTNGQFPKVTVELPEPFPCMRFGHLFSWPDSGHLSSLSCFRNHFPIILLLLGIGTLTIPRWQTFSQLGLGTTLQALVREPSTTHRPHDAIASRRSHLHSIELSERRSSFAKPPALLVSFGLAIVRANLPLVMRYTSPYTVPRQVSRVRPVLVGLSSFGHVREARRYFDDTIADFLTPPLPQLSEVSLVGSKGNSNSEYSLLPEDLLSC